MKSFDVYTLQLNATVTMPGEPPAELFWDPQFGLIGFLMGSVRKLLNF